MKRGSPRRFEAERSYNRTSNTMALPLQRTEVIVSAAVQKFNNVSVPTRSLTVAALFRAVIGATTVRERGVRAMENTSLWMNGVH